MRAGVTPCTLLVNECNAGNGFISTDACLGAFIGKIHICPKNIGLVFDNKKLVLD